MLSYEDLCVLQARLRKLADDIEGLKEYTKKGDKAEFHQNNTTLSNLIVDLANLKNDND